MFSSDEDGHYSKRSNDASWKDSTNEYRAKTKVNDMRRTDSRAACSTQALFRHYDFLSSASSSKLDQETLLILRRLTVTTTSARRQILKALRAEFSPLIAHIVINFAYIKLFIRRDPNPTSVSAHDAGRFFIRSHKLTHVSFSSRRVISK